MDDSVQSSGVFNRANLDWIEAAHGESSNLAWGEDREVVEHNRVETRNRIYKRLYKNTFAISLTRLVFFYKVLSLSSPICVLVVLVRGCSISNLWYAWNNQNNFLCLQKCTGSTENGDDATAGNLSTLASGSSLVGIFSDYLGNFVAGHFLSIDNALGLVLTVGRGRGGGRGSRSAGRRHG